jgi:flagellar biosynthesis/type III secretory pathway protein FliH
MRLKPEPCEIEIFKYMEMPWVETLAGSSESLAELFPSASNGGRPGFGEERPGAGSGARASVTESLGPLHGKAANGMGRAETSPRKSDGHREEDLIHLAALENHKAEERGRIQGMEVGLATGRDEAAKGLEVERTRLYAQAAQLAASFAEERDRYFHQLERETVQLAMAIAARILRREAQMDPLLLTGAVRVTLGQLAQSTSVRLLVPAQDQPLWEEALARMPGLALHPQVIGKPGMELGECRMETELGSADLGLWPQLKEIERGFFDRVGERNPEMRESAVSGWEASEAAPSRRVAINPANRETMDATPHTNTAERVAVLEEA